jgi:uroporphyrinogen-III synthase
VRVWVTRTRPGADRTADRLRAVAHEPVVAPVLETRDIPWTPDLAGVSAVAFTSANGVAAFARSTPERDRPVFAVGGATAAAAWEAGFADVTSAEGDVVALAALIAAVGGRGGFVLHAAGRPAAGDLAGDLERAGVPARTAVVYETVATDAPTPERLEAVLVHSPHAARVLALRLARAPDLTGTTFACISPAAAEPLRRAGALDVRAAARPEEAALLARLKG